MLSGMDSVDWHRLSHAFGRAEDVPGLLRGLVSQNSDERLEALYRLLETVCHQGTVYEVSPYVVPFLQEVLISPETPDKALPALILASLAEGRSYLEVHALVDQATRERWQRLLADEGQDFYEQLELERSWARHTHEAIAAHAELLLPFLDHQKSELRHVLATALQHFPDLAPASLPYLRARLVSEPEDHIREAIEQSIAVLEQETPPIEGGV
jgi:hypothetical protein